MQQSWLLAAGVYGVYHAAFLHWHGLDFLTDPGSIFSVLLPLYRSQRAAPRQGLGVGRLPQSLSGRSSAPVTFFTIRRSFLLIDKRADITTSSVERCTPAVLIAEIIVEKWQKRVARLVAAVQIEAAGPASCSRTPPGKRNQHHLPALVANERKTLLSAGRP